MYVNKLSELRKPLQKKLKDKVRWTWEESDTNYVKKLKSKFNHLPALYHPLPEDYMIIETDASDLYWGGILKAKNLNNEEKLCRYASGTFTGPETWYHSNEKEYLAIKKTIKKFKAYIIDKEFLIRTDSKTFGYFLRTNISEDYKQGRLLRWQQWFNYYTFKVEHIAGTKNCLADCLTRELNNTKEDL